MGTKRFFLVPLGVVILSASAWADTGGPANQTAAGITNAPKDTGIGDESARMAPLPIPPAVSYNESFTYDSFGMLPLFDLALRPIKTPVQVELVFEENVVGFRSRDGVGVMLAW